MFNVDRRKRSAAGLFATDERSLRALCITQNWISCCWDASIPLMSWQSMLIWIGPEAGHSIRVLVVRPLISVMYKSVICTLHRSLGKEQVHCCLVRSYMVINS